MVYVPSESSGGSCEQPVLREVSPGHFVRCTEAERASYLKGAGK